MKKIAVVTLFLTATWSVFMTAADEVPYLGFEADPFFLDYDSSGIQAAFQLLDEARLAVENRDWSRAFLLFSELNEIDATNPDYIYILAQLAYWKQDWDEVFRLAASPLPNTQFQHIRMLAGGAMMAVGNFREAVTIFRGVLENKPANLNAKRGLAQALLAMGSFEEATDYFRQILDKDPEAQDAEMGLNAAMLALAETDVTKREAILATYRLTGVDQSQLSPVDAATISFMQGDRKRAIDILEEALEEDPKSLELHNRIGVFYASLGRDDLSSKHMVEAEKIAPNDPDVINNKGVLSMHLGNDEHAISYFLRAIKQRPHYPEAYRNLSRVHQLRGEWQQSADAAIQSLQLDRESITARLMAAFSSYKLGYYDQALEYLEPCMEAMPRRPAIWFLAGVCAQIVEKYELAEEYYRTGLIFKEDYVLALNNLADIILNKPDTDLKGIDEALELAERASELTLHSNKGVELTLREVKEKKAAIQRNSESNNPMH